MSKKPSLKGHSTSSNSAKPHGCFPSISTTFYPGDRKSTYRIYAIHGLNSSSDTWTAKDGFKWLDQLPRWLKSNGGRAADISLVSWNTKVTSTDNISTQIRSAVRELANQIMRQQGEKNDITPSRYGAMPKQKVIIIGHSMGGILARALVGWMHEQGEYGDFLSRLVGVILLASPSDGSAVASYAAPVAQLGSSLSAGLTLLINPSHLKNLRPGSKELTDIGEQFTAFCFSRDGSVKWEPLKIACLKETAREKGIIQVVSDRSADVPSKSAPYTSWETDKLDGLSHTQVTKFSAKKVAAADVNLRKIVKQFLRMQGITRSLDAITLAIK